MNDSLVIIPTFNEKENISDLIKAIFNLALPFDILIVDDNSPDSTAAIIREMQEDFKSRAQFKNQLYLMERPGKLGLGTAYIDGFKFALEKGYEYIFEMDADFSHNPDDLLRLYKSCSEDGYDVTIGSRYITGVNVVNWPMGRVVMSYMASKYVQFITGLPILDTTAGFICYRRKVLEAFDLDRVKFVGYAFQIEMKFTAYKLGFKIKEIPIIFTDRTRGTSKMTPGIFKEAFFGVMNLKIKSWFKKYHPREVDEVIPVENQAEIKML